MYHSNANQMKITQDNIDHLEHQLQELIHEFSSLSMQNAALEGQQKKHLVTHQHLQQQIAQTPLSDEDFDEEIKHLERQLASEISLEKELSKTLHQKQNIFQNRSLLKELHQSMSQDIFQETQAHSQKQEAMTKENKALLTQIEHHQAIYESHVQENHHLEEKITNFNKNLAMQELDIQNSFQLRTLESFLELNILELESCLKQTSQLDLFYALSLRLGIIHDRQQQSLQAFRYLSYLPQTLLEWYQVHRIYEKNKLKVLSQYLLPYSSNLLFIHASRRFENPEYEIFLILSIQASIDNQEVNQQSYISLLEFYLNQDLWLQAYLMIEKIRALNVRPAKSCLPLAKITEAFSKKNASYPEQMYQIMKLIPELRDIKVPDEINLNSNHMETLAFIALWRQYQQGVALMKAGAITQAHSQFREVLSQAPYFIEAYLKLSELSNAPAWQHLGVKL